MQKIENGAVHSVASPMTFWQWCKTLLVHPGISSAAAKAGERLNTPPPVDPEAIFEGSFLKIYAPDGYVSSTTRLTTADGSVSFVKDDLAKGYLPALAYLHLFSGLPNRLGGDEQGMQPIRNAFGGWDSIFMSKNWADDEATKITLSGKRFWNLLALPVKLLVIFPLKVIGIIPKLAINVLRLVTELLPELLVNYTAKEIGEVFRTLEERRELAVKEISSIKASPSEEKSRKKAADADYPSGEMIGLGIIAFLWLAVLVPLHYAARIVGFVGERLTAPERSARDAWEFGARVRPRVLGYVIGTLGAAFSLVLTTVLWMVTLPFLVSGLLLLFPGLVPVLASIAQWPVVASSLSFIQGTFSLVAGSLPAAFSTIASALSAVIGISVSNMVLALTVTLAAIAAPVGTIGSRIADELSDGWARWKADMNFAEGMKAMFVPNSKASDVEMTVVPSSGVKQAVSEGAALLDKASLGFDVPDYDMVQYCTYNKLKDGGYQKEEHIHPYFQV